jgi:hypothetical protein
MVIPLPCALSSFSSTWSSCTLYYVHHHHLWSCGHHSMPHAPSSRVLLVPNSKHLTHGISNLVSLITKTKLGLSAGRSWSSRSHHRRLAVDEDVAYHLMHSAGKSWNKSRKIRTPVPSQWLKPWWTDSTTRNTINWSMISSDRSMFLTPTKIVPLIKSLFSDTAWPWSWPRLPSS